MGDPGSGAAEARGVRASTSSGRSPRCVAVRTEIPADAFTAPILGTERAGNGVVIRENGLVLTIGYLITEAETVWLTANRGAAAPAHVARLRPGHRLRPGPGARPARRAAARARQLRTRARSATR